MEEMKWFYGDYSFLFLNNLYCKIKLTIKSKSCVEANFNYLLLKGNFEKKDFGLFILINLFECSPELQISTVYFAIEIHVLCISP